MTDKPATLNASPDLLICVACGTQYDVSLDPTSSSSPESTFIPASDPSCPMKTCRMCDDPRQFVPAAGHRFTTLERLWASKDYHNVFEPVKEDDKVIELYTEPKFGIGQRACIIQTPYGNVMWDCIAYLDEDTVNKINSLGGLAHLIISHPHFYTTWVDWVQTFSCQIHLSALDTQSWLNRTPHPSTTLLSAPHTTLVPGLTAVLAGGHFPGSMMLHSLPPNTRHPSLFTADTIMAVPSGANPDAAGSSATPTSSSYFGPGSATVSYSFMWSIPNMIPLNPDDIAGIWRVVRGLDFVATYGIIAGTSIVREKEGGRERGVMALRERVLQSMQVFVRRMGYTDCEILRESV